MKIPFLSFGYTNQQIKAEILISFEQFLDNAWYLLRKQIIRFEQEQGLFNNVALCVGASNGRTLCIFGYEEWIKNNK